MPPCIPSVVFSPTDPQKIYSHSLLRFQVQHVWLNAVAVGPAGGYQSTQIWRMAVFHQATRVNRGTAIRLCGLGCLTDVRLSETHNVNLGSFQRPDNQSVWETSVTAFASLWSPHQCYITDVIMTAGVCRHLVYADSNTRWILVWLMDCKQNCRSQEDVLFWVCWWGVVSLHALRYASSSDLAKWIISMHFSLRGTIKIFFTLVFSNNDFFPFSTNFITLTVKACWHSSRTPYKSIRSKNVKFCHVCCHFSLKIVFCCQMLAYSVVKGFFLPIRLFLYESLLMSKKWKSIQIWDFFSTCIPILNVIHVEF